MPNNMPSDYIFLEPSPLDHYGKAVVVVHCFDDRFVPTIQRFLASLGERHYDIVSVAGGAKALFDPENEEEQKFLLQQIRLSAKLHGAKEAWLLTHADCGACGGRARFNHNPDEEIAYHGRGHRIARELIKKIFPEIETVRTFFVDEKGVIETTEF